MISAENISKKYGGHYALKNVSLNIKKGEVFALLGPNGAGKTTFVKALLGLVHLSEGKIFLNGLNVNNPECRKGVGYLPEKFSFHNYYTVYGCVEFFGKMNGLKGLELKERTLASIAKVGIDEIATRKLNQISKGQLQRTGIATLLVADNHTIILDEPFSGLDPLAIKELKDIIAAIAIDKSRTVFINSHILSEMEKICDSMAILDKGEVIVNGAISEILKDESLEEYFYKLIKGR